MATIYNKYIINIYERYLDLKNSNKQVFDNYDLSKIFEYYSCLKLTDEYKKQFYEYDDIDPTFKENNQMSRNDTGIDCSDLDMTIVQCKLRKTSLTWSECSTFFASQNLFNNELNKNTFRCNNLIIKRNSDCTLSDNLLSRKKLFIDKPYARQELLQFCENLIINPPAYPVINEEFTLRDYQIESINMIKQNKKNVIVNLPTGTGKNSVIIYSFKDNKKYLILVPRIILMDQLQDEIIKHKPLFKNKIQLIGDSNNKFDPNKNITICVFNSVNLVESHCSTFEKIYIDEAHHINKPEIYCYDDEPMYEVTEVKEEVKEDSNEDTNEYSDENEYDETDEAEETDEDLKDDSEDEIRNVKTYNQIIKSLVQYNNNVYLSATIDKIDEFEYYSKDIRQMIERGFLCDYTIHIPIFSEDPNNKKICEHILRNYRNIIIYCNSQKEGKEINRLMNELQNNSCMYIDCNTSKKNRDIIINKYKEGKTPFLVNVRILVEGFDASITKGVCFLHLPKNRTMLIQIIGRALRLHLNKTIANIILPFSSKEDEQNICNFLKVMAQNDSRIKKSFESKKLGGYISIEKVEEDTDNEDINSNIEFKYNMIYDSMGRLTNGEEIWMKRLEEVKKYIDEHKKRPNDKDKIKTVKTLGSWLQCQITNYKNKLKSMKDLKKYQLWTEFMNDDRYKKYFMSNEKEWNNNFEESKVYIEKYGARPSHGSKIIEVKTLGNWFSVQTKNYKNKIQSMKDPIKYQLWTEFMNNDMYRCAFKNLWNQKFEESKLYIEEHNQIPPHHSKINEVKLLGCWFSNQKNNYKNKINSMKDPIKYQLWTEFINNDKYKCAFIDHDEVWNHNFEESKLYIEKHNQRLPQQSEIRELKSLGRWFQCQITNYKNKIYNMKDPIKYQLWTEFMNDYRYKCAFREIDDKWTSNFEESKVYIEKHNKRPSHHSKINEVKFLGNWLGTQRNNYKNKNNSMKYPIYQHLWYNFITDPKYSQYFDQDISLPNPLPDAEQSNSPLEEFHQIEIREIISKKDIKDERNNVSAITSILNRYENKMNIDNSTIQEKIDGRPKRRNKVNRQEMFQE
jgi:superfamily II DNA or RNA helicase